MPDITYDVGRVSFVMKGAWNLATAYEKLDAVTNDGSLYIAKQDVPGGTAITNTTYWQLAAEKGDQGPTGGVNTVNGRTGDVTGIAEEDALGGTLRQLLAVSQAISFNDTVWIDLGTLNWSYSSTPGQEFFYASITGAKSKAWGTLSKALCSHYVQDTYDNVNGQNGTFGINPAGNTLKVCDTSYSDAAAFKTAMKGVLLAYEKA